MPKLDKLAERISRIVSNGRQVTIAHSSAIKPLDAPVSPRIFGQQAEQRDGTILRRQSFRVSVFTESELLEINAFRRGSQTIIEKLGLPLENGLYWLPNPVIPIFEAEIEAINCKARQKFSNLVGDNAESFVKSKIEKIKKDLMTVYRRLDSQGDMPASAVTELTNELTRRIEAAIGDQFVAPVTFSAVHFLLYQGKGVHAPWAQAAKLAMALAQFPRKVINKPRILDGLQTPYATIITAMDVAKDLFMKLPRDHKLEERARSEIKFLNQIKDASITDRDRCEAIFMLIDGISPRTIDRFMVENESAR